MKKIIIFITLLIATTVGVILLRDKKNTVPLDNQNQISVVASFYPLEYFAEEIGGEKVNVLNLTPAGAEPHDYEPTTTDIGRINESNLLLVNGAGFETWTQKFTDKNMLSVADAIHTASISINGKSVKDPHVWLDPVMAQEIVKKITDSLVSLSPKNEQYFRDRSLTLLTRLQSLHEEYKQQLAQCSTHTVVTSHAAFGYLSQEYGFTQISLTGLTPDEEPTPQRIAEVASLVRENNVQYVFFESLVSPRLAQTIAQETGAQILPFNPIEGLTPQQAQNGDTYFSLAEQNLMNLRTALSCM